MVRKLTIYQVFKTKCTQPNFYLACIFLNYCQSEAVTKRLSIKLNETSSIFLVENWHTVSQIYDTINTNT